MSVQTVINVDKKEIISILEEQKVPPEVIEAITKKVYTDDSVQNQNSDTEVALRLKILDEPDWRRRASLVALLISRSLE